MVLDRTARTARFSLRCRSNREYPDEGLQLIGEGVQEPLYCYEDWQGWSTPLSVTETHTSIFDPSRLDWLDGLSLNDHEHVWKTTLSKHPLKVMVSATPFGFNGFVEDSQIPHGKPFCLLAHENHAETLQLWGCQCCEGFCEVDLISGIPSEWCLYSVEQANSDALIRDAFSFLAFPTILRIQLRGGLKARGNQYFSFALPQVEVISAGDGASVFCNDHWLDPDPETGVYTIPDALSGRRLIVEVRRDEECIRRRSLYTLDTVAWREVEPTMYFDKFGRLTGDEATETFVGPIINGFTPPEFNSEVFLPPSVGRRVYFIGRKPGEVVVYPNESIPDDWQPVWAVQMKRRGKGTAVYCGTDPADEEPVTKVCKNRKQLRLWREVLWYMRKRITAPSHPKLRALWRRYNEVAHGVR